MDARHQEVLERLEAHAPSLASVLGSTGVQLHTPEKWYSAAIEDVANLLDQRFEPVGATEVASLTGIAKPNVYTTPGMPKPRKQLAMGSAWDATEVRSFAQARADHHKRKQRQDG